MPAGPPGPLDGKQVVLTGATNGIGLAAIGQLAARGANIALVARDRERGEAAARRAREAARAGGHHVVVDVVAGDLSSQADVRRFASWVVAHYPKVDILINNAGANYSRRRVTSDGIEMTWALNHLAPFLLTTLLLDRMGGSAPSRVITTASDASRGAHIPFDDLDGTKVYSGFAPGKGFRRYGQTKLANIVFTMELARRAKGTGVRAYSFHPGLVATGFNHNNGLVAEAAMAVIKPFARRPDEGADTLVWLAEVPLPEVANGGYFFDRREHQAPAGAKEREVGPRLWEISENQVKGSELSAGPEFS